MMVERLGSVFMTHGLGYFIGLDTHDPGGYSKEAERRKEPGLGLRSMRTCRNLMNGLVITVKPVCYFIDPLLIAAMESPKASKFFNSEAITKFRGFGGVRISNVEAPFFTGDDRHGFLIIFTASSSGGSNESS